MVIGFVLTVCQTVMVAFVFGWFGLCNFWALLKEHNNYIHIHF